MRRILLLLVFISASAVKADSAAVKHYVVYLPEHVFSVSLPREISLGSIPVKHTNRFDERNPAFVANGYAEVFAAMYDVKGPFWVGAYGSLTVRASVKRRLKEIEGNVGTVDTLSRYIETWRSSSFRADAFSRTALNGIPAVKSVRTEGGREPSEMEIYSIPLDDEVFFEVSFEVQGWEPGFGKENRWRPKVDAMSDLIRKSIVIEPAGFAP